MAPLPGRRTRLPLLAAIPPIRGQWGRPRQRPRKVLADRGYDHDCHRRHVWARGAKPVVARRDTEHGSGPGTRRWAVEQTIALLRGFRRLRIRRERRGDIHEALMRLGCALICWHRLRTAWRHRDSQSGPITTAATTGP